MPVLVAPSTPLPPIPQVDIMSRFPGLSGIRWTGWDGSVWELYGPGALNSGVVLGRRLRGLHFGDMDEWSQESPAVDGASYLGYRVKPREVFLNLRVYRHTSSAEWVEYDRAFWRSMLPASPPFRGPGSLTVTAPDGQARTLELYPSHRGDYEYEIDPSVRGWAGYGQYLTAYRPFWQGEKIRGGVFTTGGTSGFFGGQTGGKATPFVIGSSATFGSAQIDNPGDEPAWPVWTLRGPFTAARIGVPGQLSDITVALAAGEELIINTDPLAQTVTDQYGVPRIPTRIAGAPFAPVPPGRAIPLVMEMTGNGSIGVELTALYQRAW